MHTRGTYDGAGKVLTLTATDNQTIRTLGYTVGVSFTPVTTGRVQYTFESDLDLDGADVTWFDWSLGTVGTAQAAVFPGPISGIRVKGAGKLTVRIHKCQQ